MNHIGLRPSQAEDIFRRCREATRACAQLLGQIEWDVWRASTAFEAARAARVAVGLPAQDEAAEAAPEPR